MFLSPPDIIRVNRFSPLFMNPILNKTLKIYMEKCLNGPKLFANNNIHRNGYLQIITLCTLYKVVRTYKICITAKLIEESASGNHTIHCN